MAKKTAKKTARSAGGTSASAKKPAARPSGRAGGKSGGPMDLPLLEQLVRLMAENELTNIELQDGAQKIILSRGGQPVQMVAAAPAAQAAPAAPQAPATSAAAPAATAASDTSNLVEIKSPMVGTYYASPSPDAKAFVEVGSKVGPDSDVCIIEAMKVFNNIKAETSGTIEKILAENGQAVEYGQPLFLVRPA